MENQESDLEEPTIVSSEESEGEDGSFSGEFELELSRSKMALRMGVDATKRTGLAMLNAFKWMVVKVVALISIAAVVVAAVFLKSNGENNSD